MTDTLLKSGREEGGRRAVPCRAALLLVIVAALLGAPSTASAHAEPERAEPPINGSVPVTPGRVEIWFTEEVASEGTVLQVIGPGGIQVDLGDTTLDLMDPNRQHVTISLRPNLGPGAYTVQWRSMSAADGDSAQGGYLFRIGAASPEASPVATSPPVATTAPQIGPTAVPAITVTAQADDFDSRAYGISVLAGLGAAVAIFIFWRLVRPRNPKF